jgi:acetyltransferase-like isoleucine patch superfamily enzyme
VGDEHYLQAAIPPEVDPGCRLGVRYRPECGPFVLEGGARIRSGTIIYGDVRAGEDFATGHNVLIREETVLGAHVMVGTASVLDGRTRIGDFVKIETGCYIPTDTTIGSRVFLGPHATLTNDRYPLRQRATYRPEGPILEDDVTLGAGVVICPGVRIGAGSFVAAGAVVTKDVPPGMLVRGVPARWVPLPASLRERNRARSWDRWLEDEAET